jgi:hypothetical protein
MSDEIITAESLQAELKAEEGNEQQDKVDSPDENETSKDENLENTESADDASEDVDQSGADETEKSGELAEDETTESPIETDESEESQEIEEKSKKPDIPKWVEQRLQRERRKHEREMNELRKQQPVPPPVQYDPNTQIQDPFTGNIVDVNSVDGQVVLKLQQVAAIQEQAEQQQKTQKNQEELKRKLEKGYAKFDDFEDVVVDAGVTQPMLEAAYLADNTDELLYNLAKYKPEEIDRISKLSPERQFREMVLLESKMKQSTKKKIVKKVPEPPSKIKGSGQSIKDESDMSFEDVLKRRRKMEKERLSR